MTARILRIELRRSAAWWTALVIALGGAALLYVVATMWGGRWMPLAIIQREQLYGLWPLALAAGGWQGRREARVRIGELLTTTARPGWQRVVPTAGAMGIGAAAGYVAMFAAGAGQVVTRASYVPAGTALVVAIGALSMVAAVWLGLAAGRLLPSPFTPPALVLAGYLVLMATPVVLRKLGNGHDLPAAMLLSPVLTPPTTDFYAVAGRVQLIQGLWITALAVTAFALYASSRPATRLVAVLPAALGLAVVLPLLPTDREPVYVADAASYAPVCAADRPRVCVTRVHAAALEDLRAPAHQALAILSAKLPDAPSAVTESHTSWIQSDREPQPPDTLLAELNVDAGGHLDGSHDLLWSLLDGAGTRPCPTIFADPSEEALGRHHAARLAAASWLMDQAPPTDRYYAGQARQAWDTLRQVPADEQRARVVSLRAAALACDGRDLIDVLTGSGSR